MPNAADFLSSSNNFVQPGTQGTNQAVATSPATTNGVQNGFQTGTLPAALTTTAATPFVLRNATLNPLVAGSPVQPQLTAGQQAVFSFPGYPSFQYPEVNSRSALGYGTFYMNPGLFRVGGGGSGGQVNAPGPGASAPSPPPPPVAPVSRLSTPAPAEAVARVEPEPITPVSTRARSEEEPPARQVSSDTARDTTVSDLTFLTLVTPPRLDARDAQADAVLQEGALAELID